MTVTYIHTHLTPYALIIIIILTLTNNQSNFIQYNFDTLSMTITLSYFVLNHNRNFFKKCSRDSYVIGNAHRRIFSFHLSHTKIPTEPSRLHVTPSQPLVAPQVIVSRGSLKFHRSCWEALRTVVLFPRADLPRATQTGKLLFFQPAMNF